MDVKFPNFTFEGGRKQNTTNFSISLILESGGKNPTAGEFICLALERTNIFVAFDNARTLNIIVMNLKHLYCYK